MAYRIFRPCNRAVIAGAAVILAFSLPPAPAAAVRQVSLVIDDAPTAPIRHGLEKLRQALQKRGLRVENAASLQKAAGETVIVAGLASGGGAAARMVAETRPGACKEPESLLIRRMNQRGKPVLLLGGADARALMYALLDVAERVSRTPDAKEPFGEVRDADQKPFAPERALSIYTFNRAWWESRFYDEAYWSRYLDLLARNRFNSLVLIFGYENGGFLAPCFPYFFDVEGYPDVRMVGITPEQQRRNLAALNRLIDMAHDRGIRFTAGLWDHIYRGGVQGGGIPGADEATKRPTPGLVWGVTGENLSSYTQAALRHFVKLVPALDAIQFRMHDESGLKISEQETFWRGVFRMMKSEVPGLRLDLRAKGLPDSVIQSALDVGVKFRITTKYWMEQMGLPFHPTHINVQNQFDRRHSYADMLRFPQRYRMHWRLWNGGTARVLLWGDPDYARRFVESTRLYDGDGFEVNEPLCTKMLAQPHDARPFELLAPVHRYYDYEFERYWHFFRVFGRLGYDPAEPPDVWRHEFEERFGKEAAPFVEKGLHQASRVLPRIVASCYPYSAFPMTRGWAEKQRLGDLPAYARAEGSDIQQFASFDEEAQMLLEGGETAKVRPAENSRWFAQAAAEIDAAVAGAERRIGARRSREFDSTVADLKILSCLALYHSRRIPAAVSYRLYERAKDGRVLDDAIAFERGAVDAWRRLVAAAGDFYAEDLKMGVRGAALSGHWKDELAALEKGLTALQGRRSGNTASAADKEPVRFKPQAGAGAGPSIRHRPVTQSNPGSPLPITAEASASAGIKWVRLRYRSVNQQKDYATLPMLPAGEKGQYRAVIPAEEIVPAYDLMYFIEAADKKGSGRIYPDLNVETPYIVVRLVR